MLNVWTCVTITNSPILYSRVNQDHDAPPLKTLLHKTPYYAHQVESPDLNLTSVSHSPLLTTVKERAEEQ